MPLNISTVGHSSLPPQQSALTTSQATASPSPQETQTRINQAIQIAAQSFDQIAGANTFTTQTNDTGTTVHFGDGTQGANLPTGSSGDTVYRTGSGNTGHHPPLGIDHLR